jgi:Recombination directionality factor-like
MPIHGDILGYQRRSLPIGEIRMGYSVEVPGKDYRKPMRSDTWRFTTGSEQAAGVIVEKYNGTMAPWERRKGRWRVITDRTALDVWVPPRGEAVDTSMEMWDGPRWRRKCDGVMMSYPERKPCMCPLPRDPADPFQVEQAKDERERLAGLRPPQACKVLTRFALTIPELPGLLGVWRLNTGSVNAAVETADSGDAMAIAREGGAYLPAVLRIEWRPRAIDGTLCQVPVLMIGKSMRELAEHALPAGPGGLLAQLQGATAGEGPRAIAAPALDVPGAVPSAAAPPAAGHAPVHPDEPLIGDEERRSAVAQAIADRARTSTTAAQLRECAAAMKQEGVEDEFVWETDNHDNGSCCQLDEFLREQWREKAREGAR